MTLTLGIILTLVLLLIGAPIFVVIPGLSLYLFFASQKAWYWSAGCLSFSGQASMGKKQIAHSQIIHYSCFAPFFPRQRVVFDVGDDFIQRRLGWEDKGHSHLL